MFKNILVPHDGSELSQRGLGKAVQLAKATGATITGFHVAPDLDSSVRAYLPRRPISPRTLKSRPEPRPMTC